METTAPTSGSCSGRRQLPAPNNGTSRFHTRSVWMTTSGLQIQQSSGSGRVDLTARRCAYSRETSLLIRSSRNGTTLKVGEKRRENLSISKGKGVPYLKEKEGGQLPWLPHVGLNPHGGCGWARGSRPPGGPHSAHLGQLALFLLFFIWDFPLMGLREAHLAFNAFKIRI